MACIDRAQVFEARRHPGVELPLTISTSFADAGIDGIPPPRGTFASGFPRGSIRTRQKLACC